MCSRCPMNARCGCKCERLVMNCTHVFTRPLGGGGIHNLPIIGRLFRRRACNFQRCVKCAHLVMKGDGRIIAFYKTDGTYMVEYKDADGDVYRETIDCRKHKIQK